MASDHVTDTSESSPSTSERTRLINDISDQAAVTEDEHTEEHCKKFNHAAYACTKSSCHAAINVALITSNAAQLKIYLDNGRGVHVYFDFYVICLIVSIGLQVVLGFLLAWLGSREGKLGEFMNKGARKTKRLARAVTAGEFIISMINIVLNGFSSP